MVAPIVRKVNPHIGEFVCPGSFNPSLIALSCACLGANGSHMKTYYLDFVRRGARRYGGYFHECQDARKETFAISEIDEIAQWGFGDSSRERNLVDTEFYREFKHFFEIKPNGFFAWKPYIIHDLLSSINDGDMVVYWDCIPFYPRFSGSFIPFLNYVDAHYEMISGVQMDCLHSEWTKRDCFELMACVDRKYWINRRQIQATWSILKKTDKTMKVVGEWMRWCQNENVVRCDLENICGKANFEGFKEHRWDQSVITNLSIKHHCTFTTDLIDNKPMHRRECKNIGLFAENYARCEFVTG